MRRLWCNEVWRCIPVCWLLGVLGDKAFLLFLWNIVSIHYLLRKVFQKVPTKLLFCFSLWCALWCGLGLVTLAWFLRFVPQGVHIRVATSPLSECAPWKTQASRAASECSNTWDFIKKDFERILAAMDLRCSVARIPEVSDVACNCFCTDAICLCSEALETHFPSVPNRHRIVFCWSWDRPRTWSQWQGHALGFMLWFAHTDSLSTWAAAAAAGWAEHHTTSSSSNRSAEVFSVWAFKCAFKDLSQHIMELIHLKLWCTSSTKLWWHDDQG